MGWECKINGEEIESSIEWEEWDKGSRSDWIKKGKMGTFKRGK